jgi:hypothetical protein
MNRVTGKIHAGNEEALLTAVAAMLVKTFILPFLLKTLRKYLRNLFRNNSFDLCF